MTQPPTPDLSAEVATVEAQFTRADTKAGLLLALAGGAAAAGPLVLLSTPLALAATIPAWCSTALFATAAAFAALAVRPSLKTRSRRPYGFMLYATLKVEAIHRAVEAANREPALAERLRNTSIAAATKYRRIRYAVDLTLGGLAMGAAAAITAMVVTR